ncbi:MAG TPA: DUF1570 domain-containing protein [Myxococcales bacterium]|jgi:hypothetical protein
MRRLALCLLALSCAHAPPPNVDQQQWFELQTEHFTLRTNVAEADARQNIADMEQARLALRGAGWHSNHEDKGRTIVVQFASSDELHEVASKSLEGFAAFDVFGEPIIVIHAGKDVLEQDLFKHELTHVINNGFLVSKPRWVNEGIACYLETLEMKRGHLDATMGKPSSERLGYLQQHPGGGWFTVMSQGSDILTEDAERGYAFETSAWILVHYFVDYKPESFEKYLNQLARGVEPWKAFGVAFPGLTQEELAQNMRAYLKSGNVRIDKLKVEPWKGSIAVRALPRADVHALRANLFRLSVGFPGPRKDLERAELASALSIDPANPYALMMSADADPSAATKAHPDDWRSWFVAADRRQYDLADISRAAKLAPDVPGVVERLALAEAGAGDLKQALTHATLAVDLAPGRPDGLDVLAQVYAASGRCDDATSAEQRAMDAVSDNAGAGAARYFRSRMDVLASNCSAQRAPAVLETVSRTVATVREVKLRACSKPVPRVWFKGKLQAVFTIGKDGKAHDVAISGNAAKPVVAVVRKYVESCSYEPQSIDGKPVTAHRTLIFSPSSK